MVHPKVKNDYLIGIITALPIERAAVTAMLDERHPAPADFVQHLQDSNSYTWGSIGSYNVVMASLSTGVYGTTSATNTVLPMTFAFPNIKWGLMVGIGAGIPSHERDIRLGDVAVSQPIGSSGGVFQYDLGKLVHDNEWKRSDWLARPPDVLLKALGNLQAEHEFNGSSKAQQYLIDAMDRHAGWAKSFASPQVETDRLFEASYSHHSTTMSCTSCDPTKLVQRTSRETSAFRIHYGVIASGNSLVKNASLRDKISRMEDQCICIEMEAAGLMNSFPCLVIRGICDYADSHKNDVWQRYASATAAAFAKELLTFSSEIDFTLRDQRHQFQGLSLNETPQADKRILETRDEALLSADAAAMNDFARMITWQPNTQSPAASTVSQQTKAHQEGDKSRESNRKDTDNPLNSSRNVLLYRVHYAKPSGVSRVLREKQILASCPVHFPKANRERVVESSFQSPVQSSNLSKEIPKIRERAKTTKSSSESEAKKEQIKDGPSTITEHAPAGNSMYMHANSSFDLVINAMRSSYKDRSIDEAQSESMKTSDEQLSENDSTHEYQIKPVEISDEPLSENDYKLVETSDEPLSENDYVHEYQIKPVETSDEQLNEQTTFEREAMIKQIRDRLGLSDSDDISESINKLVNDSEWTLLHLATSKGDERMAKTLIECGAYVDVFGHVGRTPLHLAALYGHSHIIKLLLDNGAAIDGKDRLGEGTLYLACMRGDSDIVRQLLDRGADVRARDKYQETPLHRAARNHNAVIARLLLAAGADRKALDGFGKRAADYAGTDSMRDLLTEGEGFWINSGWENRAYWCNNRADLTE